MATDSKFPWMKWVTGLVLVGVALGGGAWYWRSRSEAPVEYQSAPVARGDLTQVVTATGQLDPVVNVTVGSQISGIIQKLFVDYNSQVKSNQVIAEIDPATYKVNVLRVEADVANAKANLSLAQVQADRADALFTNKLISASDHDTAGAQLLQAKAQVQSAQASLANANVDLSRCTIYAPVDGVVVSRNVDVGQTVAASFNTPTLFLIAGDLTKMQIDALVSEADIGGVSVGQRVNFTVDAYPYRTFSGKLSQIRYGAITNQNVINYDCVVEVSNPDGRLLPGMTANVSIVIAERQEALKIPNAALRFRPPEVAGKTNAAPQMLAQGGRASPEGGGRGGGPSAGGPGGRGGLGAGGGRRGDRGQGAEAGGLGGRPRPERQLTRTVYVLPSKADTKDKEPAKLKAVQIKVGISDGIMTEVTEGLAEGMQVVTGAFAAGPGAAQPGAPAANPFGGGGFRRF